MSGTSSCFYEAFDITWTIQVSPHYMYSDRKAQQTLKYVERDVQVKQEALSCDLATGTGIPLVSHQFCPNNKNKQVPNYIGRHIIMWTDNLILSISKFLSRMIKLPYLPPLLLGNLLLSMKLGELQKQKLKWFTVTKQNKWF